MLLESVSVMSLNNAMKIFVDGHVFDGEFQGTFTYLQELYSRLIYRCPEITFYFGAKDKSILESIFGHNQNVQFISYRSTGSLKRIFFEIPSIIDELECTHAHFQYILPFKLNQNCKYIVTIHDILFNDFPSDFSFLYRFKRNYLFRRSANVATKLLTVSDYSRERIAKRYCLPLSSIVVTPNAVSGAFSNFNFSKSESGSYISNKYSIDKYILFVSRVEPRKNQELLLKAFIEQKLANLGFQLVFIGSDTFGSEFTSWVSLANQKNPGSVYWFRKVNWVELMHFYNAAEFFTYPSSAEGFGIPPLEAACMQTPVLCSNVTAMQDFDFFKPHTFDPNNSASFVDALNRMVESYNSIDTESIKYQIMSRYSWDATADVFVKEVLA